MDLSAVHIETFESVQTVENMLGHFVDVPRYLDCCRQCPRYGQSWACPPHDFDTELLWRSYTSFHICIAKIYTPEEIMSGSYSSEELTALGEALCRPLSTRLLSRLQELSREHDGSLILNSDGCHICKEDKCARSCGLPCRHPEQMTRSIEAFGVNAEALLSECFGEHIQWGKNGKCAEYYIRIGGLLIT